MTAPTTPQAGAIRVRPATPEDISLMARWAETMALETEDIRRNDPSRRRVGARTLASLLLKGLKSR